MNRSTWSADLSASDLGTATIRAGHALAEYGDPDGTNIFPSVVGLAKRLGYRNAATSGRRCVQRLLRRLVDAGWIIVDARVGRKGRGGRTNRYRLTSPYADLSDVCVQCELGIEGPCPICDDPADDQGFDRPEPAVKRPPDPTEKTKVEDPLTPTRQEITDAVEERWSGKGDLTAAIGLLYRLATHCRWTLTDLNRLIEHAARTVGALVHRAKHCWRNRLTPEQARTDVNLHHMLVAARSAPARPSTAARDESAYGPTRELQAGEW